MNMELYHGSAKIIESPQYELSEKNNDFGRGFYCTENIELAKEWACGKDEDGYTNKYMLDINGLKILDLNSPKYNILNWLAILTNNRTYWHRSSISEQAKTYLQENFLIDMVEFDVIRGCRADDSYFSFAQDFVANTISLRQLSKAMHLGKLEEQIVIMTPKAFDMLTFKGYEEASANVYFTKKEIRDKEARKEYRESKVEIASTDDLFMLDIMREGIKDGDSRLQQGLS
ncbi:MAG: DUF3990 domain-containing protein [Lachnospiraceae bacterium]|nr:DUF3990 domain-containing protein [Lachnospiraceae bacterium]MDE6251883.1 DUF3990 domain-containing protein [Lachnospiraceae bacterium]